MNSPEIIKEIRKLMKFMKELGILNNYYATISVPLSIAHPEDNPYVYEVPKTLKINTLIFMPAKSSYKYRLNNLEWISVAKLSMVKIYKFEVNKIEITNEAGEGNLDVILEGII